MEAENWHQVKEILELAIEQPPGQRERFIAEKCSGDAALRSKIDSLIDSYEKVGDFMEDGAIGNVADAFSSSKNDLKPGDRLGRYRIEKILGEGGMGKVYLADDLDLHRQVAIKVLRDDLWWYKQARQRLLREARAAARLDHANICSIYEIEDTEERSFIVMQYVEGETLNELMAHGRLSIQDSLRIALQIADALDAAHSRHIIHRDIKPANIIVNKHLQAKVLDFGLAKSIEPQADQNRTDISSAGAVMGTVPYMSPEQLRGKNIDGRSDIFSFGSLLYEMLSGRQAFSRESNAETMSAILSEEPNLSHLPLKFRRIIEKSLRKKAGDRYQRMAEMAADLRHLTDDAIDTEEQFVFPNWFGAGNIISTAFRRYLSGKNSQAASSAPSYYRWQDSDSNARTVRLTEPVSFSHETERHALTIPKRPILLAAIAILAMALIPVAFFWFLQPQSDPHSFDFLRSVQITEWKEAGSNIYLGYSSSHDGKMIAYSATREGEARNIYVKPIAGGNEVRVTRDEWNNFNPIWSPDDQRLAFISNRNGSRGIYFVPFSGGETTLLQSVDQGSISLRYWSKDGSIVFYEFKGNLFSLDLAVRQSHQITSFEPIPSPNRDFAISPGEDKIVYCDRVDGQTDLWTIPLKGGGPVRLTNDPEVENHPAWHPDGKRIVYSVERDKHSQISVAYLDGRAPEQATRGQGEHQLIDISSDGTKLFYTTWEDRSDVWGVNVDTEQEFQVAAGREAEFWSDVSPDGKSVLYQTNQAPNPFPLLQDSKIVIRPTGDAENLKILDGYDARWLPNGRSVAFLRWQGLDKRNALWIVDTITGEEKQIINERVVSPNESALPYNRTQAREFSFSFDGSEVVFVSNRSGISNIVKNSLTNSQTIELSRNLDPATTFYSPLFSPDGKRIAYVSVQKQSGKTAGAITRIWLAEGENSREIHSTTAGLRLLGWQGNDRLIIESTDDVTKDGFLKSVPVTIRLITLTLAGSPQLIAQLTNVYANSASLSPDGKMLAFTIRQNGRDDIFTLAPTGRIPRKISSNDDPQVYLGSLTWSPDGKTVYFDRQERVSIISMFENFR